MKSIFKNKVLTSLVSLSMLLSALPGAAVHAQSNADYYPYAPYAYSYRSGGGSICLNWRNPEIAPASINVYDITDGAETPVDGTYDLTASKGVVKIIEGLEAGKLYQYKVVFTFEDETETSIILSSDAAAFTAGVVPIGTMNMQIYDENITPELSIVTDEKKNGNASLHITNNWDLAVDAANYMHTWDYCGAQQAGKNYTLKGYAKANDYIQTSFLAGVSCSTFFGVWIGNEGSSETFDWKEFTTGPIAITDVGFPVLRIFLPRFSSKDLWLDDLTYCEEGTTASMINGSFEGLSAGNPSMTAAVSGTTASINVTPASDSEFIYIYQNVNGTDITRAVLDASQKTVLLEDVEDASSLKIAAKNASMVMSEKQAPHIVTEADYYPYTPTINGYDTDGTSLSISWRNPVAKASMISVYDITVPAAPVLVRADYDTTSGKAVSDVITGLEKDGLYTYKVEFEFADHAPTSVVLSDVTGETTSTMTQIAGSNWYMKMPDGNQVLPQINIDTDTTHDGSKGSLHISNNYVNDNGIELWYNRFDGYVLDPTAEYTFSVWLKMDQCKLEHGDYIAQISNQAWWGADFKNSEKSCDWTKYECTFTDPNASASWAVIRANFARANVKDIWIDDISLVKTGTTENLLVQSDFEDFSEPMPVTDANATSVGDGTVNVSYRARDCDRVYVYQNLGNAVVLRANVSADANSVTIEGLKNDVDNQLILKTMNSSLVMSSDVSIMAKPTAPAISTGNYKLYSGSEEVSEIKAGEMTVKLSVKNNDRDDKFTPCYIVALYNDGEMVDYEVVDTTSIAKGETKTLSASVTVPEITAEDNYKIKAFLWNDFKTMGILKKNFEK